MSIEFRQNTVEEKLKDFCIWLGKKDCIPKVYYLENFDGESIGGPKRFMNLSKNIKVKIGKGQIENHWDYIFLNSSNELLLTMRKDTMLYLEDYELMFNRLCEGLTFIGMHENGYYDDERFILEFKDMSHDPDWKFIYRFHYHLNRKVRGENTDYYPKVLKEFAFYTLLDNDLIYEYKAIELSMSDDAKIFYEIIADHTRFYEQAKWFFHKNLQV